MHFFFFFFLILPPPRSTLFPYTTLFRSCHEGPWQKVDRIWMIRTDGTQNQLIHKRRMAMEIAGHEFRWKSTRLNSSHVAISYAVFCLKKKTQNKKKQKGGTNHNYHQHDD